MSKRSRAEIDIERRMSDHTGDSERLNVLERARQFKRSWMELAEGLTTVRGRESYARWGYGSYEEYCARELHLRKNTAEKLTASYGYLSEYAPHVLERDGITEPIPEPETIQALARARGDDHLAAERFESLQEEALAAEISPSSLARKFKEAMAQGTEEAVTPEARQAEHAVKLAHKLADLLAELRQLPETLAADVEEQLGRLIHYLDERILSRVRRSKGQADD